MGQDGSSLHRGQNAVSEPEMVQACEEENRSAGGCQ